MKSFDRVYQYLGEKEGKGYIHISEIAENCGITMKEAEDLFFSGKLGLAGSRISFNCQICSSPINKFISDKKRLCPVCANAVEVEGKLHEMVDDKPKVQEAQQKPKVAPSHRETVSTRNSDDKQYGFKRLND